MSMLHPVCFAPLSVGHPYLLSSCTLTNAFRRVIVRNAYIYIYIYIEGGLKIFLVGVY